MEMVFGDLISTSGWARPSDDASSGTYAGVSLGGAPADFRAAFPDAVEASTAPVDAASFNRHPFRLQPGFTIPWHQNNMDELIVVLAGELAVRHGGVDGSTTVGPSQFFVVRAGTAYELTSGTEGVTYLAMWPEKPSELISTWGSDTSDAPPGSPGVEFYDFLDDEDWPIMAGRAVDRSNPGYFWHDGRPLSEAPIDMEETFRDAMMVTTKVASSDAFRKNGWNGLRCRPNFMVPRHHHNMRELIIVFGGEYTIEFEDANGDPTSRRVTPGQFFISQPGTPYTMIAGPEGVTYTECWPDDASTLETYWHDRGWVHTD